MKSLLEVVVEGLSFIFDNLLHMALLGVIHFNLFDAVVSPQVAFEVVGKEINQSFKLLSVVLQIGQYFRNEVVQLLG